MSRDKLKNRESFVAVDERGNLGKSLKGERYYFVIGSVFKDPVKFAAISRYHSLRKGREVKYHDDFELRLPVIQRTSKLVDRLYYSSYRKDRRIHNSPEGMPSDIQESKHIQMLEDLADKILSDLDADTVYFDVDHSDLVKDYKVRLCFEKSPYAVGRKVTCTVNDSSEDYILMTHDYLVGALGDLLTDPAKLDPTIKGEILAKNPIKVHPRKRGPDYKERWRQYRDD